MLSQDLELEGVKRVKEKCGRIKGATRGWLAPKTGLQSRQCLDRKEFPYHTDSSDGCSVEFGTLVDASTNKQSTVGSTVNGELLALGVLLSDEVLSSGLEVVENVLLVSLDSALVPRVTILATTADVSNGEDASERLHPDDVEDREPGGQGNVESSIAIELGGVGSIENETLLVNEEEWDAGAVLGVVEDTFRFKVGRVVSGDLGLLEGRDLLLGVLLVKVYAISVSRVEERGELEEHFGLQITSRNSGDSTERRQLKLADVLSIAKAEDVEDLNDVTQVDQDEVVAIENARIIQDVLLVLRDDIGPASIDRRIGSHLDGDDLVARGLAVGLEVQNIAFNSNASKFMIERVDELVPLGLRCLLGILVVSLGFFQKIASTGVPEQVLGRSAFAKVVHHPLAIVAHRSTHGPLGVVGGFANDPVILLGGAEAMVVDGVVQIDFRFTSGALALRQGLRLGVTRVEEASIIKGPLDA